MDLELGFIGLDMGPIVGLGFFDSMREPLVESNVDAVDWHR
jgi:hypothetical protein